MDHYNLYMSVPLDPPYPVVIQLPDGDVYKLEKFTDTLLKTYFEDAHGNRLIDKYKITNVWDHVHGYFVFHTWYNDYKITRVSDNKVVATISRPMPVVTVIRD